MGDNEWRQHKEPSFAEEVVDWQMGLPRRFLFGQVVWDDDAFIPEGASEKHRVIFHRIYRKYFLQIFASDGFDIDIYPGKAKAAMFIPYLDFEKETDLLMELANNAIHDYNIKETNVYKYEVLYVEKVNFILAQCREFFMTVKVKNLTLRSTKETFQIHAYKGPDGENIVRLCRRKLLV